MLLIPLLLAPSNALAADEFESFDFYFGDIHEHTGASGDGGSSDMGTCVRETDGLPGDCGSYLDLGTMARDNGLDFFASLDHVTSIEATTTAENFQTVFDLVNGLDDPTGGLVTLPGAEVFVELPDGSDLGHRSLLFFGDQATLSALTQVDTQPSGSTSNEVATCETLTTFMDALTARFGPALLLPHHPGVLKPMATDWTCFDATYEPLAEVYSEHGSSLDVHSRFDVPWSGYAEQGTVRLAIDPSVHGLRMGFGAGSDNHDTHGGNPCRVDSVLNNHPYAAGLTAVWQPVDAEFSRTAIFTAFTEHRTYATTGPMIPLIVEIRKGDGTLVAHMGESIELASGQDLIVEARVPAGSAASVVDATAVGPLGAWRMIEVSPGTWSITIPAAEMPQNVYVDVQIDGVVAFPAGCEDGGADDFDHLWSSPVFFDPIGPDEDGDGWSSDGGDCDDTNADVNPAAREACEHPSVDQDCDGLTADVDPDCEEDTGATDSGDTGDTDDTVDDTDPVPTDTSADAASELPITHRFSCDTGGSGAALGLGTLLAIAATSRRRRPC